MVRFLVIPSEARNLRWRSLSRATGWLHGAFAAVLPEIPRCARDKLPRYKLSRVRGAGRVVGLRLGLRRCLASRGGTSASAEVAGAPCGPPPSTPPCLGAAGQHGTS